MDRIPADYLVQQLEFIRLQFFDHVLIFCQGKPERRDRRLEAFLIALEIGIDLEGSVFAVPACHPVGAAAHRGMGQVAVLRIHHGGFQELLGEDLLRDALVFVPDIDAVTVVIDLAAGGDLRDRVRQEAEAEQFEEIRQVLGFHRELDHHVVENPDAGEVRKIPGDIILVTLQIGKIHGLSAQFRHFGGRLDQNGERVIPGGDLCAVGVVQVVRDLEYIPPGAVVVVDDYDRAGYGHRICVEDARVVGPGGQIVGVDQGADIDIGRGRLCRLAGFSRFRCFGGFGFLSHLIFGQRRKKSQQHDAGQQHRDHSFHIRSSPVRCFRFPLIRSRPPHESGCSPGLTLSRSRRWAQAALRVW